MKKVFAVIVLVMVTTLTACSVEKNSTADLGSDEFDFFSFIMGIAGLGEESANEAPPQVDDIESHELLASLEVRAHASKEGYTRPSTWAASSTYHVDAPLESRCDVREAVLYRDGKNVQVDDDCNILQGVWLDPYNNVTYSYNLGKGVKVVISHLEIEHIVPFANAYVSGAYKWTDETFKMFAHDVNNLIVVNGSDNSAKGDKGPESWEPENSDYHCEYATSWVKTKAEYELSITKDEQTALYNMLETC